jgi:hypothetical protein
MEIKSMQDLNNQERMKEAWAHQNYSGYKLKRRCSLRFMTNKQYRKKTLWRRANSQNHHQKKTKTHFSRIETTFDNRGRITPQETTWI